MIKRLPRKCYVSLLLAISLFFATTTYAQSNQVVQGNIIREISLSKSGNIYNLNIKGMLHSSQLQNVIIRNMPNSNRFSITIPNAMLDPEKITTPFIAFGPGDPLENIRIMEKAQEGADNKISFSMDLIVEPRQKLVPEIKHLGSGSSLMIALTPQVKKAETAVAMSQISKADYERKKAQLEERKELAEQRDAEMRQQQSLKHSQKEVQKIIRHYRKPSLVQVSILNASGYAKRAYKLSVYLGKVRKKQVEETLGIKLDIVNIANSITDEYPQSTIYYRDNYLKSALYLANLIPGEQKIVPLKNQKERIGVDIEIFLGKDYK